MGVHGGCEGVQSMPLFLGDPKDHVQNCWYISKMNQFVYQQLGDDSSIV